MDDPAKYPGREANAAAGGWAGGEKGLWQLREELKAKPPVLPKEPAPQRVGSAVDVDLKKDFNSMAGGFPGGEVGVRAFTETVRGAACAACMRCMRCMHALRAALRPRGRRGRRKAGGASRRRAARAALRVRRPGAARAGLRRRERSRAAHALPPRHRAPQGKVATRSAPPSVGLGAYLAVAVAASYAAVVYSTGDLNPQGPPLQCAAQPAQSLRSRAPPPRAQTGSSRWQRRAARPQRRCRPARSRRAPSLALCPEALSRARSRHPASG